MPKLGESSNAPQTFDIFGGGWDPLRCCPQTTLLAKDPAGPIACQNTSCPHEIQ